jgi:hypothetical protein
VPFAFWAPGYYDVVVGQPHLAVSEIHILTHTYLGETNPLLDERPATTEEKRIVDNLVRYAMDAG